MGGFEPVWTTILCKFKANELWHTEGYFYKKESVFIYISFVYQYAPK